jgi:AraC-like DNA-binding protein
MKLRTTQPNDVPRNAFPAIEVTLLQTLFDLAPDVSFFVKDAQGRYLMVNDSLLLRHGLKRKSDAIGKCPHDICPGDFGRIPSEQDARVLRTGKPLINHLELQWFRPHDPVWCLTTKLPIRGADGKVSGLIGFSRDVRAPVERQEIPAEFAAALVEFENDLSVNVTAAWLAQRSKLSPQRLGRLTKRLFGLTPMQLIAKTRIATASRLLRETNKSIAEISQATGFYDHSAFTRAFRSATGVTPSFFRIQ